MRKKTKKHNRARIVLRLPDSRPFQDLGAEQCQLSQVATKLSVRDGPIHRLVLF
jgi:hypothetical protein